MVFQIGDKVKVNGYEGEITGARPSNKPNSWEYFVEFDPSVIGNDWYPESSINDLCAKDCGDCDTFNPPYGSDVKCPNCNVKWKITQSPVLGTDWHDCPKCKKTREQVMKELEVEWKKNKGCKSKGSNYRGYSPY